MQWPCSQIPILRFVTVCLNDITNPPTLYKLLVYFSHACVASHKPANHTRTSLIPKIARRQRFPLESDTLLTTLRKLHGSRRGAQLPEHGEQITRVHAMLRTTENRARKKLQRINSVFLVRNQDLGIIPRSTSSHVLRSRAITETMRSTRRHIVHIRISRFHNFPRGNDHLTTITHLTCDIFPDGTETATSSSSSQGS